MINFYTVSVKHYMGFFNFSESTEMTSFCSRSTAFEFANLIKMCEDCIAVEIINGATGEVVYTWTKFEGEN